MSGPIWSILGGLAGLAVTKKGVDTIAKGLDAGDSNDSSESDE